MGKHPNSLANLELGKRFKPGPEQAEIARLGGIASKAKEAEKKSLRSAFQTLLTGMYTNKKGELASGYDLVALGLFKRAQAGDPQAVKLLAEIIDELHGGVDIHSDQPLNIVVNSQETSDKLKAILAKK